MFDTSYPYVKKTHRMYQEGEYECCRHVFTFRDYRNEVFIVHVEEYPEMVYAIKFYQKSHRDSENKWCLKTNAGDAHKKIGTCYRIMMDEFFAHNPFASFAFHAVPNVGVKSLESTQRHRIYRLVMSNLFNSGSNFWHVEVPKSSCYLLANKSHQDQGWYDRVKAMFTSIYPDISI